MQGMSDGLELAADDIDHVVNQDIPPAPENIPVMKTKRRPLKRLF